MFGTWFKKSSGKNSLALTKPVLLVWLSCLSFLGGAWLLSGCTSDLPSDVGTGLVDDQIDGMFDAVLETLRIKDIEIYNGKNVSESDLPLAEQEVVYLGSQGGNESAILLNYDFSNVYTDSFPEDKWTVDNISFVKLQMVMLEFYGNLLTPSDSDKSDKALTKVYEVFELDEAFVPEYFPGPVPEHGYTLVNDDGPTEAELLNLSIQESHFLDWVATGGTQGLVIYEQEGPESTPGLIGFSSKEMEHPASTLIPLDEGIPVAPVLAIKFVHNDSTLYIEPTADTSSFHSISEAPTDPAEGMMMRTCLRNYPMMRFDFSTLPPNVFINRAVLSVTNDTTVSFGNLQALVISEISTDLWGVPGDTMPLANLPDAVYQISGMVNLDPIYNRQLEFNVTTAVQRYVNEVYEGDRGFIMTAGEDFFPGYDIDAVDPDFFFTQFQFLGTNAAEHLRPQLKISYSQINSIDGGDK